VYGRSEYFSERRSPKTGKSSAHVRNVAQWPVRITEHHPAYIGWEEFVKNQERLRQNWGHDENRGVPPEGRALLQGIVYCGVCGRKMSVQNRAVKESRSPSYVCGRGYQDGEEKSCQCMTSRPIDAAVAELERRWNEKLERVTELERAFAQAERDAEWKLKPEERAAIRDLSRDLPAIWSAETTTNQERKQLLRMTIESVQVDGSSQAGQVEVQICWRSGMITSLSVKRAAPGERSLKTAQEAVSRIHKMALRRTYAEIATALNRAGLRSAFGRRFTSQHVGYICRRDGLAGGNRAPIQNRTALPTLAVQEKVE
jgi:hypothetical protein